MAVEITTELTQYHLSEEQRREPTNINLAEYAIGTPVLFMPVTITNVEIQPIFEPHPEHRFLPGFRNLAPSGRLSIFEADTLNSKRIFQVATVDVMPNYEGAVLHGYLAFTWEGYGEYRLEIIWAREIGAEYIFNVDGSNAIISVAEDYAALQEIPYEPEPETDTTQAEPDVMVWRSATGTQWHSINNCGTMNPNRARQITLDAARRTLDGPCDNCNPPR